MLLKAEKIKKSYPQSESDLEVLKEINLAVASGQRIAIMGPSGSGKSTLLSILACLDRSDSGALVIHGTDTRNLTALELNQFRARHIGIIFQNFHLLDRLTALENIQLPLDFLGIENGREKALAMLKDLGLEGRAEHFPNQMSRGECQRVAIGRVLVTEPKIIFADEPTGSLDVRTANQIMDLLWTRIPATAAFIMVTHDPRMAKACEKIYSLNDGRLTEASA